MSQTRTNFINQGFHVLENSLTDDILKDLEDEYQVLYKQGQHILQTVQQTQDSWDAFYQKYPRELIVVPEAENPKEVCRLEYLSGYSKMIQTFATQNVKPIVDDFLDAPFTLFKDKCNLKHPNGGAFSPHQDIAAYYHFGPAYFVTAALFLDDATIENGCLEMAGQYRQELSDTPYMTACPFGEFPFLDFYKGVKHNGDIQSEITHQLSWTPVEAQRGNIVLFDAYVPHQSKANASKKKRRVFFFTFNATAEGDLYHTYYETKRRRYGDPMFHVSTPTQHSTK